MTTKQLAGLQHVFTTANEFNLSSRYSPLGIPALMRNLYGDTSSFLYKQYRADGLARAMNIYETIFDSPRLIESYQLFGYPALDYTMRTGIALTGIDVLIEALKRAIATYLVSGEVSPARINLGLRYISELFGDLCFQIGRQSPARSSDPRSPSWDAVQKIASFLGRDCMFIKDLDDWKPRIVQNEDAADGSGFTSQLSIAAGFAQAICDALSQLATIDKAVIFRGRILQ